MLKALEVRDSFNEMNDKLKELNDRLIEIENLKVQRTNCLNTMETNRNELRRVSEFIQTLTTKLNQLEFNKETYNKLIKGGILL